MSQEHNELTVFDLVDWVWSYRILAAALGVVCVGWIGFITLSPTASSTEYYVHFRLHPTGTPIRSAAEISGMISSLSNDAKLVVVAGEPAQFTAPTEAAARSLAEQLHTLEQGLVAEVATRLDDLAPYLHSDIDGTALTMYLQSKSFLAGQESGLIDLIDVSESDTAMQAPRSRMSQIVYPVVVCGFAFFAIALLTSFFRSWRGRKRMPS